MTGSSQTEGDPRAARDGEHERGHDEARRAAGRDAELRELTWDLACASGALSEIATCWRRSFSRRPGLPPGLPLRLTDAVRRIEADARFLADDGHRQAPAPAMDLAERFAEFRRDYAGARELTRAPGAAEAGDALLWDLADAALSRAGDRLLRLILMLAAARDPVPGARARPAVLLALNADDA